MIFHNKKNALIIACGFAVLAVILFLVTQDVPSDDRTKMVANSTTIPGNSTSTDTVTSRKLIVAFGDSITAGYGIALSEAYPKLLEEMLLARGHGVVVVNSGVSGETTAGGLRRAEFVAMQKPDIVLVALGGNDVLRGIPPSNTKENLAQIIAIFQNKGIRVVLVGMYAPENLGEVYVREFNALYPDLARTYAVPLVPFLLEGVALDPALNQNDGIHPNQAGARIIAEQNMFPILEPMLR
jgi:acyl-CoA thioesterase-1